MEGNAVARRGGVFFEPGGGLDNGWVGTAYKVSFRFCLFLRRFHVLCPANRMVDVNAYDICRLLHFIHSPTVFVCPLLSR
jgi:hypothetical protein